MERVEQSPFFEVPVRWFEIPMNAARWGFVQPKEIAAQGTPARAGGTQTGEVSASSPTARATSTETAEDSPEVGRFLNERA
jgi:hypothetical protein